ncbi:MAG: hypothetical protein V2J10_00885 [Wenzhouxiangella sp.]|jgi:hypothetical protein|nr:hypothetical protein [Wenzhouxiangella sp.]
MTSSETHIYLSLIPQALVASMLSPEDFGSYYALGERGRSHGQAMFFEVDPDFRSADFPFEIIAERCVPTPTGEPKKSVYLGIYRVLSRIPVSALGKLYLVTADGNTLALSRETYTPGKPGQLHLYQEFCPISPLVVSRLDPHDFCRFITNPEQPVHVPRIAFSELELGELADSPAQGNSRDLPYRYLEHLRDCLQELASEDKETKLVQKEAPEGVYYRMVKGGFYVGDQSDFAFYRFPSDAELRSTHWRWWRSAQIPRLT